MEINLRQADHCCCLQWPKTTEQLGPWEASWREKVDPRWRVSHSLQMLTRQSRPTGCRTRSVVSVWCTQFGIKTQREVRRDGRQFTQYYRPVYVCILRSPCLSISGCCKTGLLHPTPSCPPYVPVTSRLRLADSTHEVFFCGIWEELRFSAIRLLRLCASAMEKYSALCLA